MTKDEALDLALEALKHLQPTALNSFYTIGARERAITAIKQALAEPLGNSEQLAQPAPVQEAAALEALVMICVKCRSNEWGPDTPRKEILNWFHDFASKALDDATPPAAQRQWVGLTDDEKLDLISDAKGIGGRIRSDAQLFVLLDMQEAKLKEKNT